MKSLPVNTLLLNRTLFNRTVNELTVDDNIQLRWLKEWRDLDVVLSLEGIHERYIPYIRLGHYAGFMDGFCAATQHMKQNGVKL
jgi:hypothetical protein